MDFELLTRAARRYDLPEFVKAAEHLEPHESDALSPDCFLDPVRRQYPTHTKSATWLSSVDYFESALVDHDPNLLIGHGLLKAAKVHDIAREVQGLIEKIAADYSRYTGELPDASYALVAELDGRKQRFFPVVDAGTVKKAAEDLYAARHRLPLAMRKTAAKAIRSKADAFGVQPTGDTNKGTGQAWHYLEKAAGRGTVSGGRLGDAFKVRSLYLLPMDKEASTQLDRLGTKLQNEFKFRDVPRDQVEKSAAALDKIDRETGLFREYPRGLMLPEEQLYDLVEQGVKMAGAVPEHIRLTNGSKLSRQHVKAAGLEPWRVMPEYLDAVAPHGVFDLEKAAELLPTLPRPDAQTFELAVQAVLPAA